MFHNACTTISWVSGARVYASVRFGNAEFKYARTTTMRQRSASFPRVILTMGWCVPIGVVKYFIKNSIACPVRLWHIYSRGVHYYISQHTYYTIIYYTLRCRTKTRMENGTRLNTCSHGKRAYVADELNSCNSFTAARNVRYSCTLTLSGVATRFFSRGEYIS